MMGQRHPNINKNMAIAYGLALELDREGMDALLRSAGYALSDNSGFDLVVMFCVERHIYDFLEIRVIAQTVCEAFKIPVQGEDVYAGKPEIDIDPETFDASVDAGTADQASKRQKTSSDFRCDNFTTLLEQITESLDGFTETLGDGADEEPSEEAEMSEDEAAVYQKVRRVAEPLVSLLNSMADQIDHAALEIIGK
jgi:hypothetical protein